MLTLGPDAAFLLGPVALGLPLRALNLTPPAVLANLAGSLAAGLALRLGRRARTIALPARPVGRGLLSRAVVHEYVRRDEAWRR